MRPASRRRSAGFTAIEIMIVVAIIGIFAPMAVPSWRGYQANLQLRAAARTVANAFSYARSRALATGNRHVVVFAVDPLDPNDVCGNPIVNSQGVPVPVLVFEDNDGGAANCCYDAGEERIAENAAPNVNWGVTGAIPQADEQQRLLADAGGAAGGHAAGAQALREAPRLELCRRAGGDHRRAHARCRTALSRSAPSRPWAAPRQ